MSPATKKAPAEAGALLSADVVAERYFANITVRGRPVDAKWVRRTLAHLAKPLSKRRVAFREQDVEEWIRTRGQG